VETATRKRPEIEQAVRQIPEQLATLAPMDERRRDSRPRARRTARDQRRRTHGQNFIRSDAVARELVTAAGVRADDLVVEVGAGAGVITEQLARHAGRVLALELDPAWARSLGERFAAHANVTVRHQDVLRCAWPREPFRVVGNIPFGITTPLLHALLDDLRRPLVRADVIVQHEVARKRATPGPATVLGVSWAPWFAFRLVRRIPAAAFSPVPAVDGAHMAIERRAQPLLEPAEQRAFARFVRAGFARGGHLRAGLRSQLTNNQVRILRATVPFDDETLCNRLDADAWVALFAAARPYLGAR